jgi:outer membrane usher protein
MNAGLSFSFREIGGTLSYQHEDGNGKGILDLRKDLPIGPGYGYGFQASTSGDIDSIFQYQTSFGRYEANYNRFDGQQGSRLSAAGGLAFIDNSVQFTRPVQDSFALIKVPGLSGVRGYLNNLEVGKTDSGGRLFVPNLLSYYGNNLGISRKDLPFNYNLDVTDKIIASPYRGGAVVEFPAARIQRVVGKTMIDHAGKTLVPKFGQLTITGQSQTSDSPLGNDGEFYFENLKSGRYRAQIETKEETCEFSLDVPPTSEETIQLGLLTCVAH